MTAPVHAPGVAPRISVVLPTRDRAALLPRALRTVRAQTVRDWELVVVDDASTDGSGELLRDWSDRDGRIRAISLPAPVGAAAARNHAIARARGRYVAFLDDDTEWAPDRLERHLTAFERGGPDVGVVYGPYALVGVDGRERVVGVGQAVGPKPWRTLLRRNDIGTPAATARRALLDRVGGFDERLPRLQDWDLWVRLAEHARFGFVPELLVRCLETEDGISRRPGALASACAILEAKMVGDPRAGRDELADWRYALGHVMLVGGVPREGRRMLLRSLRSRPWPLRRCLMAACALAGERVYAAAVRWRGRVTASGRTAAGSPEDA